MIVHGVVSLVKSKSGGVVDSGFYRSPNRGGAE